MKSLESYVEELGPFPQYANLAVLGTPLVNADGSLTDQGCGAVAGEAVWALVRTHAIHACIRTCPYPHHTTHPARPPSSSTLTRTHVSRLLSRAQCDTHWHTITKFGIEKGQCL